MFALLGELFVPKTFGGVFGSAPSVAIELGAGARPGTTRRAGWPARGGGLPRARGRRVCWADAGLRAPPPASWSGSVVMEASTPWVALALYYVEDVDLADADSIARLVGVADMIDHAILLADEVARALDDLSARGCLEVEGSVCRLTAEVRALADAAVEESGSHMAIRELRRRLAPLPCFIAPSAPAVDPVMFRGGVDRYVERSAKRR